MSEQFLSLEKRQEELMNRCRNLSEMLKNRHASKIGDDDQEEKMGEIIDDAMVSLDLLIPEMLEEMETIQLALEDILNFLTISEAIYCIKFGVCKDALDTLTWLKFRMFR